jgi:hypothetical protein
MKLITLAISDDIKRLAAAFRSREGSQHIADVVSLEALLRILGELKPKNVLEIGAGIGTMSHVLLQHSDADLVLVEDNDFCIRELRRTLGESSRYKIVGIEEIPVQKYDLIIVDGYAGESALDNGGPGVIQNLLSQLPTPTSVFVQGKRFNQRREAREALSARCVYQTTKYEGIGGKGGYEIRPIGIASPISRRWWQFYHESLDFPIYRVVRKLRKITSL